MASQACNICHGTQTISVCLLYGKALKMLKHFRVLSQKFGRYTPFSMSGCVNIELLMDGQLTCLGQSATLLGCAWSNSVHCLAKELHGDNGCELPEENDVFILASFFIMVLYRNSRGTMLSNVNWVIVSETTCWCLTLKFVIFFTYKWIYAMCQLQKVFCFNMTA